MTVEQHMIGTRERLYSTKVELKKTVEKLERKLENAQEDLVVARMMLRLVEQEELALCKS